MSRKELIIFGAFVAVVLGIVALFATKVVEIQIELPPAEAPEPAPAKPIYIVIADDGSLSIDGAPSSLDTLAHDVAARSHVASKDEQPLMIRAGETVRYETFMTVMNRLQDVGWTKVGIVRPDDK